jgi:hypothetical protein
MTLFLIENSLHFPRIEPTEPAAKTRGENGRSSKHDPEKWRPVFGKDHAQTKR